MKADTTKIIQAQLDILNIEADETSLAGVTKYCEEIVRWTKKIDLTGARTVNDFVAGPLFDALTLVPSLMPADNLVDVGSGGGLPGIPAALLKHDLRVDLVEPREKRISFLNRIVHTLGLSRATVRRERFEHLEQQAWSGAVAQAVWAAPEWIANGLTLVQPGGHVYCLTSDPVRKSVLPGNGHIDDEREYQRPRDSRIRLVYRIKRTE